MDGKKEHLYLVLSPPFVAKIEKMLFWNCADGLKVTVGTLDS